MICPKCNEEYREGFTKCADCDVDLVEHKEVTKERWTIKPEGIRLVKFGIILLFVALAELIMVVLTYELYVAYMSTHGFMMDYVFVQLINPIIWYIFAAEAAISLGIIVWGISFSEKRRI